MNALLHQLCEKVAATFCGRIGIVVVKTDSNEIGLEKTGQSSGFIYSGWFLCWPKDIELLIKQLISEKIPGVDIDTITYRFNVDKTRIYLVQVAKALDNNIIHFRRGNAPPYYPYPLDSLSNRVIEKLSQTSPQLFVH